MESMSRAPHVVSIRDRVKFGDTDSASLASPEAEEEAQTPMVDALLRDGLIDSFSDLHMGVAGELQANMRGIDRDSQDSFAGTSYQRAQASSSFLEGEIVPVIVVAYPGASKTVLTPEAGEGLVSILPEVDALPGIPEALREEVAEEVAREGRVADAEREHSSCVVVCPAPSPCVTWVGGDEQPSRYRPDKMSKLRPAFIRSCPPLPTLLSHPAYRDDTGSSSSHFLAETGTEAKGREGVSQLSGTDTLVGTITAANAPSLNDGAAALVVTLPRCLEGGEEVVDNGVVTEVVCVAEVAVPPLAFTEAPTQAIRAIVRSLALASRTHSLSPEGERPPTLSPSDIDLYEVNEAFSCVALGSIGALGLDPQTVNVHGGSVGLGHPIGCSGARITGTLARSLQQLLEGREAEQGGDAGCVLGVAAICNGGGGGSAILLQVRRRGTSPRV
ncbi:hypothetical protein KIPB_001934 [Kipferlia bialata]|uniref:Thiolase C-terminal domain-containing protein n=1 Tax=Kipferlia bialata TaxID=797122 RepID=A0A9K3GGB0_9EUKA|nr:hypothetical protein KIPB_001934 [Kipferlia bialata]|eukprot:g1934.t1